MPNSKPPRALPTAGEVAAAQAAVDQLLPGHGLYYVARDGGTLWRLDGTGGDDPTDMPDPERAVLVALLRYVLDRFRHRRGPSYRSLT